jgi:hypothetical protein
MLTGFPVYAEVGTNAVANQEKTLQSQPIPANTFNANGVLKHFKAVFDIRSNTPGNAASGYPRVYVGGTNIAVIGGADFGTQIRYQDYQGTVTIEGDLLRVNETTLRVFPNVCACKPDEEGHPGAPAQELHVQDITISDFTQAITLTQTGECNEAKADAVKSSLLYVA